MDLSCFSNTLIPSDSEFFCFKNSALKAGKYRINNRQRPIRKRLISQSIKKGDKTHSQNTRDKWILFKTVVKTTRYLHCSDTFFAVFQAPCEYKTKMKKKIPPTRKKIIMEWSKITVITTNKLNIDGNNKNAPFKRNKPRIPIELCQDGIRKLPTGDRRDPWLWCARILAPQVFYTWQRTTESSQAIALPISFMFYHCGLKSYLVWQTSRSLAYVSVMNSYRKNINTIIIRDYLIHFFLKDFFGISILYISM